MLVKALISVAVLSAALSFSGFAFAQGAINGVQISADDLPKVQARCNDIATSGSAQSLSENSTDGDTNTGDSAASADATTTDTPQVNAADQATSTYDLDTLDAEACAGLTTGAM